MSTYGLVVVADLPDEAAGERMVEQIRAALNAGPGGGPGDDIDYEIDPTDSGVRVGVNIQGQVADRREAEFFTALPDGRAVICEDGDEYGVVFQVWRLGPDGGQCLYRAYVHDPDSEPEPDTAARTTTGPQAAAAATALYGVDAQPFLDLEADPSPVSDELGIIGTPFDPWMNHLNIDWPEP